MLPSRITWRLVLFLCTGIASSARASTASFNDDGRLIYAISLDAPNTVEVISEKAGTWKTMTIDLGKESHDLQAICRAGEGRFYLLTDDTLWLWKPEAAEAARVEKAPEENAFLHDVTCNPATGEVLLSARLRNAQNGVGSRLYYKPAADKPMVKTFLRHIPTAEIHCPLFLPDGTMLFSADGDLWHGVMEFDAGNSDPVKGWKPKGDLSAYRFAPLAQQETYSGTPSGLGVSAIAVSKGKVYVHLHRWHGSGWGHLARLNLPVSTRKDWRTRNSAKDYASVCASVEELEDNGSASFLCGSADGSRIYFTNRGSEDRTHFLIEHDGKAEPFRAVKEQKP